MVTLDTFVEKYLRLSDDLHEIRWALKDIRACFVALTASCYVGILLYALLACLRRRRQPAGRVAGVVRSRKPVPRKSKSSVYDVEAGEEWDEMMAAPPDAGAVKTLDGYRYKSPVGARRKSQQQAQSRRASEAAYGESGGGRQQSLVDNRTALMKSARFSDNARTNLTFGEGFIEKSPSVN